MKIQVKPYLLYLLILRETKVFSLFNFIQTKKEIESF